MANRVSDEFGASGAKYYLLCKPKEHLGWLGRWSAEKEPSGYENRRQRCSDTHKPDKRVSVALAGCGNSRICHPEPASFAGEGSAVRKKAKEKADSSPRSETERGSE